MHWFCMVARVQECLLWCGVWLCDLLASNINLILFYNRQINQSIMLHSQTESQQLESDSSFNLHSASHQHSEDEPYNARTSYYKKKAARRTNRTTAHAKAKNFNHSLWNPSENAIYLQFLCQHAQLFDSDKIRRKRIKINVQMSQAVTTRTPDQCRSHHQKMMKRHRSTAGIIQHLSRVLSPADGGEKGAGGHLGSVQLRDLSVLQLKQRQSQSIWEKLIENWPTEHAVCCQDMGNHHNL